MPNKPSSYEQCGSPSHNESQRLRILIVDDNSEVAECLSLLLETLGHETAVATCGADAIETARRTVPHTMLIDIGMPQISGYELARRLRNEPSLAGIRLIALSGYGQDEDRRRAIEAGFDAHLTKPASSEALESAIWNRPEATRDRLTATLSRPRAVPAE
jgi:CheY-like chemotaxis protein